MSNPNARHFFVTRAVVIPPVFVVLETKKDHQDIMIIENVYTHAP